MVDGFGLGGFAEGLAGGLSAGTQALAPGREMAERQAERQAKVAEQARTQVLGQIKGLDTDFEKVVSERGREAAQRLFDGLRAKSITLGGQKVSHIDLLAMQAQQAGIGMITPEILESRLSAHLAGGQTTDELAGKAQTMAGATAAGNAAGTASVNLSPEVVQAEANKAAAIKRAEFGAVPTADLASRERQLALAKEIGKPLTDAGKFIYDKALVDKQFGADSPQAKAFAEAQKGVPSLSDESGLRNQFTQLSKDFVTSRDAFGRISAAYLKPDGTMKPPSPANDLALIFGFMKMLDPQSVVRESEQATAENARGVPDGIRNLYNKVVDGTPLTDAQRKDFLAQSEAVFSSALRNQANLERAFGDVAVRAKIDPRQVVLDFMGDLRKETAGATPRGETAGGVTVESIGRMGLDELSGIDPTKLSAEERKALDARLKQMGL